jgi:four helix bundle protein
LKTHKDLDAWKVSMDFVVDIYTLTRAFPSDEIYGLTNQMKRAAISVPSNIAEGAARKGDKEFIQFLYVALGSVSEIETQLLLAERLKFSKSAASYLKIVDQIKQMLFGLIRYIKNNKKNP